MAVFRVQVFYEVPAMGKWTNVWHVESATLTDARFGVSTTMVPILVTALDGSGTLLRTLISEVGTSAFVDDPQNESGTFTGSGPLLPLFNCVKVLFTTSTFGRPHLKYIKGIVGENVQTDGVLDSVFQSDMDVLFQGLVDDMSSAGVPLVTEAADTFLTASVQSAVQMRQLHRKRRRSVTP